MSRSSGWPENPLCIVVGVATSLTFSSGVTVGRSHIHVVGLIASSRSPSAPVRMMGAMPSGKMPGSGGRLPVRSRRNRNSRRIASWLFVRE